MTETRATYDHGQMQHDAAALQTSILRILAAHVGAGAAIQADAIARTLGLRNDRAVREAIRQLRRDGRLILSSVGARPGYYLAATAAEWAEFRDGNLRPRALDILETANAMAGAAARVFGMAATQMRMEL